MGLCVALAAALGGTVARLAFWREPPPTAIAPEPTIAPAPPTPSLAAPVPTPPPAFAIATASATEIEAHRTADLSIFRLAENPRILVLDFASLAQQGRMLDRVAALIEKSRLPRDRILENNELDRARAVGGDMAEGFYYGHDYAAASLARFFRVADRDRVTLTQDEAMLRRLLEQEDWLKPGVHAGLISVPRIGADQNITSSIRNAILTHELAHGEYFSNPGFADQVRRFWATVLTAAERDSFRAFLADQGYDTADPEIVENEMQAYVIFTTDPHFFLPTQAGLSSARRSELRLIFLRGMQDGWLKALLSQLP